MITDVGLPVQISAIPALSVLDVKLCVCVATFTLRLHRHAPAPQASKNSAAGAKILRSSLSRLPILSQKILLLISGTGMDGGEVGSPQTKKNKPRFQLSKKN